MALTSRLSWLVLCIFMSRVGEDLKILVFPKSPWVLREVPLQSEAHLRSPYKFNTNNSVTGQAIIALWSSLSCSGDLGHHRAISANRKHFGSKALRGDYGLIMPGLSWFAFTKSFRRCGGSTEQVAGSGTQVAVPSGEGRQALVCVGVTP